MRVLKVSLISLAALLVLFVGASLAAFFLLDLGAVATAQVQKQLPAVEKKLGRKVTVGPVTASFFPRLSATVRDVEIADRDRGPGGPGRPLLHVDEVSVRLSLLDALLSMGKRISVDSVAVDGLAVDLVRFEDGTLSHEDVLQAAASGEEAPPPAPGEKADLSRYVVGELLVRGAAVRLEDRAAPGGTVVSEIRDIDLRVTPLGVGRPITVALELAAFEPARNLWLDAELAPIPVDGDVQDPAALIRGVHLRSTGVDLSRLAPYAGGLPLALESARLVSDLDVRMDPAAAASARGSLELKGVKVQGGELFDLAFRPDLTLDRAKGVLDVRSFELAIGEVKLAAKGRIAGLNEGMAGLQLDGVEVRSDTLDLGKLLRYWPIKDAALTTAGAGRLELKVSGDPSAQTVAGLLDLTAPRVIVPGTLDKPPGVPLSLKIDGRIDPRVAQLSAIAMTFGPVSITGNAELQDYKGAAPRAVVKLASGTWSFGELARLVPAVQQGMPQGGTIGGDGSIRFSFDGTPGRVDLDAEVLLSSVDLAMPGTRLAGGAKLSASVQGDPAKDLAIDAALDARDATIVVEGSVDKPAGVPLNVDLSVLRRGPALDVKKAALLMGALRVDGSGTMNQETGALDMKLSMPPLDIGELARTFPSIKEGGIAGGTITTKLSVEGNPQITETLALVIGDLRYTFGKNRMNGTVRVENPSEPRIVAELDMPYFNLDEVMPPTAEEKARKAKQKAGKPEKKPCPPPSELMKKLVADLSLRIGEGVVSEIPFKNLQARAQLRDGVFSMDGWSMQAYGGKLTGRGTRVDLASCAGEYMADLSVEGMDLAALLAQQTSLGKVVQGKLTGRVVVNGKGLDRYYMTTLDPEGRRLSGVIESQVADAKWDAVSLSSAALAPASKLVPGMSTKEEHALGSVISSFDVKDGRFVLAQPMKIGSGSARTELTGSIGMDHTLQLAGTYFAKPALLSALSGGRCRPGADVPVPIAIAGTLKKPEVSPSGTAAVAEALGKACLGGKVEAAKEKLEAAIGEKKEQVVQEAGARIDQARQEAEKKAAEQKKAAEKKATDQAKKAGKKVLKGLGF